MSPSLKKVRAHVLRRITPNREDRARVSAIAKDLKRKVEAAVQEVGIWARVGVEGSVAKDTWLRDDPDIDLFMRIPATMPREAFGSICLKAAKKATHGFEQTERFAEHPYLECTVDNVRVNIVPCYDVRQGEWVSATDRTPFHTSYVKSRLDRESRSEVRLLKQFMMGINTYGAEIKVGGFSGYLCELLVLHYGSLIETLESAGDWDGVVFIDLEDHYERGEDKAMKAFKESIVVVDPIDKGRNVAAAVRDESRNMFIAAARAFLKKPDVKFFYPSIVTPLDGEKLVHAMRARGSALVFVRFGKVSVVPDILWGQLYRSKRSLSKMLQSFSFKVIRNDVWSDDGVNVFVFELEEPVLPLIKKHFGPPIEKREDCERFLEKYLESDGTISGPRVEGNRWVVEVKREYTDVTELLTKKLRDGGKGVGVGNLLSKIISDSFQVLVNEEILELYSSNTDFAKFLTTYLKGRPGWL